MRLIGARIEAADDIEERVADQRLGKRAGADELAEVKQAIASCPTAALKLIDG